ncbi:transmembrane protein, putative (macronuclear) [Tetrahymena thermophila SB210]|uniref:Transmembrane protein, putative n=1 Tax=Tetrahymena thermophila (strain SB210) TaxID=312017 RepID=I7MJT7_TETTS|nr:transmembrane protein, putative [Tetrahymena thermophila SB210]EAR97183.1 transmembrane protein, putative [Tetrahymena thermophila SB210]|eukprot:XP_001017428.1 transmembrane protein, putative [Tetrahymena thermophila SB210]
MRKTLVILIIASALLVSFVESKKQIRKQKYEEVRQMPLLNQSQLESSSISVTFYNAYNDDCFSACETVHGNSLYYYQYQLYMCCHIGLTNPYYDWYYMECYPQVLKCKGDY